MTDSSGYQSVRPHNVGPHDVKKDEKDKATSRQQPEKAYGNEVAGQAAIVGPASPPKGSGAGTHEVSPDETGEEQLRRDRPTKD